MKISIIIPVYNRPQELQELLQSIANQQGDIIFEVIVVEDGSINLSDKIVEKFIEKFDIHYFFKENSGPGESRNLGMQKATGDYLIIVDSDCVLPPKYLSEVLTTLQTNYTDAYGGADTAHPSFSKKQKAISYSMTSFFTTGGIRGSEKGRNKFQLRSFNMGLSREAFLKTKGFSKQHFGEDIDLTFKLWNHGFKTQFIPQAFVYHKRRATWRQFLKQTFNFGSARPILTEMQPHSSKITFWFPALFILGFLFSVIVLFFDFKFFIAIYGIYFLVIFFDSLFKNKNILTAVLSVFATLVQFSGYGLGFLRSVIRLKILQKTKEETFPAMFR